MPFTPADLEACLRVLQEVADDPSVMDHHERFKALVAKVHRLGKRGQRRRSQQAARAADRATLEQTGRVAGTPGPVAAYHRPRACYICKAAFTEVDAFYHLLCPKCAEVNAGKRAQRADLRGRYALLTGGRVKLGYHVGLRLLRDGAHVVVTTRFPNDAHCRYEAEADSHDWLPRLHLVGLDLRDVPALEAFTADLTARLPALDMLINNAAQTIRRPREFYTHLLPGEPPALLEARHEASPTALSNPHWFPAGRLDAHGEQVDLSTRNSWSQRLHEVGTIELVEVQLVNAIAPFLLASRLKPLLLRSPFPRRFVVNVSAMEGQFGREARTGLHPHTCMAKAGLNMLTRAAAGDYAADGIFMTSVDPGWFSDQKSFEAAQRAREDGFVPPLDCTDGAARVYDPIARGVTEPEEPMWGVYLKDYAPYPW